MKAFRTFGLAAGLAATAVGLSLAAGAPARAAVETHAFSTAEGHSYVRFKISHIGFSWLVGRFNHVEGTLVFDPDNPAASKVSVEIDPATIDSNHAARDKHLRNEDFLDVESYPDAGFESTSVELTGPETAIIRGDLTLRGVTREVALETNHISSGMNPWGDFVRGFYATTSFALKDFGFPTDLGPASQEVMIEIGVEGHRQ